jgi:glyoxylase-like metal-dependent hydrolase (beta-lactamase superfamily II)
MIARVIAVLLLAAAFAGETWAQTPELDAAANREIVHITGDLYRFKTGAQHSVFLATRNGIVVVDPLGLFAASWLQAQLRTRFPNVPVSHVVLTHHHAERAGGAGVFNPGTIVGHERFRVELSETSVRSSADYRYVVAPRMTVGDRETLEAGGSQIDLIHTGLFHSPDMIAVSFRKERVAFIADYPPLGGVPFTIGRTGAKDVLQWLRAMSGTGCETVLFGDGTTMACRPLTDLAQYLGAMRTGVLSAYDRGYSLNKTIERLTLEAYRSLPHHAGRAQQITDMYRQVRFWRGDIALSGIASYLPERDPDFCTGYDQCQSGGVAPGGTASFLLSIGRRFGVQVEAAVHEQFWSNRARPSYQEETALRLTGGAAMVRFNVARSRKLSLLAGVAQISGDVRGLDRVAGRFEPAGGRHAIREVDYRTGFIAGIEFSQPIGPLRIVVPMRYTQISGAIPAFWSSRMNATAGIGISFPLFRVLE